MKFELIEDWDIVAKKAWSSRLIIVAGILSALEFIIPFIAPTAPSGLFAAGAFFVSIGAFIARFVAQPKMRVDQ